MIELNAPRVATKNTHGTGCTLSAALAALLPQTGDVPEAARRAKAYLTEALRHADQLSVGAGHGPVHHFHSLWRPGSHDIMRALGGLAQPVRAAES